MTNNFGSTLTNNGTLNNNNILTNDGTLSFQSGSTFTNTGTLNNNNGGVIESYIDDLYFNLGTTNHNEGSEFINYANMTNSGFLTNASGVKLTNARTLTNKLFLTNAGTLTNSGTLINNLALTNDGTLANNSDLINDGALINNNILDNNGNIIGTGTFTQTAGATINNGSITQSLISIDGGTLGGSGMINGDVNIGDLGSVNPGNSPGALTINGDFTSSGIFNVEIGGLLAGTEYDVLDVTGIANLGGTLNVDFFDLGGGLFDASLGNTFDILSAESMTGQFDLFTLAMLGNGLDWQLDYLIDFSGTTDIVRLSVVSAVPVPASVWLFSSGLLGLIGVARRKKT